MSFRALIGLGGAVAALLAAGCAPVDPGMGEAFKYDMVAQTVNPEPAYAAGTLQAGSDGTHAALATEHYRKDSIKQPARESSTSTSASASGGNK